MTHAGDFTSVKIASPVTRTATNQQLQKVELAKGQPLPPSYCAFAKKFGYGLFLKLFIIYIPMEGPEAAKKHDDTLSERRAVLYDNVVMLGLEEKMFEFTSDFTEEIAKRLVPFGITENGDTLAWDPEDKTGNGEWAIYFIANDLSLVVKVAKDLYEFTALCTGDGIKKIGPGYKPLPAIFEPRQPA